MLTRVPLAGRGQSRQLESRTLRIRGGGSLGEGLCGCGLHGMLHLRQYCTNCLAARYCALFGVAETVNLALHGFIIFLDRDTNEKQKDLAVGRAFPDERTSLRKPRPQIAYAVESNWYPRGGCESEACPAIANWVLHITGSVSARQANSIPEPLWIHGPTAD